MAKIYHLKEFGKLLKNNNILNRFMFMVVHNLGTFPKSQYGSRTRAIIVAV